MNTTVHVESDCRITTLVLNRPDKLNAISYEMVDQLLIHLDVLEEDPNTGVVIVTGAGDRAFSAGADIPEFSASVKAGRTVALREFVRRGQHLTARIEAFPKPIIAAVNGLAFGGGCEITEAAHLAVAADSAVFAKPEILLGMPPTFGGTQRLARLGGRKRALELLLTGERFSAERALELGLVNRVTASADVLPAARKLAASVLEQSAEAVSAIIGAVTRGINLSIDEGLTREAEAFAQLVPSQALNDRLDRWINRTR